MFKWWKKPQPKQQDPRLIVNVLLTDQRQIIVDVPCSAVPRQTIEALYDVVGGPVLSVEWHCEM